MCCVLVTTKSFAMIHASVYVMILFLLDLFLFCICQINFATSASAATFKSYFCVRYFTGTSTEDFYHSK